MSLFGNFAFGQQQPQQQQQPAFAFGAQPQQQQQPAFAFGAQPQQQQQQQQAPAPFAFGAQAAAPAPAPALNFGFPSSTPAAGGNLFGGFPQQQPAAAAANPFALFGAAAGTAAAAPAPAPAQAPALDAQDEAITRFLESFPRFDNGRYAETTSARRPLTQLASLLDPYRKAGDRGAEKLHGYALRRLLVNFREDGTRPPSKLLTDGEWADAEEWKDTYAVSPALALPPPFMPAMPITVPLAPMPVEGFEGLLGRIERVNAVAQGNVHERLTDLQHRVISVQERASTEVHMDMEKYGAGTCASSFDKRMRDVRQRQRELTRRMLGVCQSIDMVYAKRLRLHESSEEMELREDIQALLASLSHAENLEMRVQDVRLQLHEQLMMALELGKRMGGGGAAGGGGGAEQLPDEVLSSVDELQGTVTDRLRELQAYNKDVLAAKGALARMRGCCGARTGGWGMHY